MSITHDEQIGQSFVLGGGVLTDGGKTFIENGAVRIRNGRIEKIGETSDLIKNGFKFLDVRGRLIIPGLLNPHHHLYSFLATGLRPRGKSDTFTAQLQNFWWRLDSVLDEESIYYSALLGLIDSIKCGVTMIFDHHASMGFVRGSLATIAKALELTGVKGVLCFETSDRRGKREVDEHIAENLEFHNHYTHPEKIKGVFGLHANFTLSDSTLKRVADIKPDDMPIHIHCAEDIVDLDYCLELGYDGAVDRLNKFGLLSKDSIIAHAIHLTEKDYEILEKINPVIVTNPESNANNQVGSMNRLRIRNFLLGTDGMSGDIAGSLRSCYLLGSGRKESMESLREAFFDFAGSVRIMYFPETGILARGMKADLAVMDYTPITPISLDNLLAHLIFGMKSARAYMTIADGTILQKEGKLLILNEDEIGREAKKAASRLHEKYYG